MKTKPTVPKLRKALTRILCVTRKLAVDAEYDYLNGRSLPTGFRGRHSLQRGRITRALRTAWNCAMVIDNPHLNAVLIAIDDLTEEVVIHSVGFFPNNDYDARHSPIWAALSDLRSKVIEVRCLLKSQVSV